jgi:hypothetical protein
MNIRIPVGTSFDELALRLDDGGTLVLDWSILDRIDADLRYVKPEILHGYLIDWYGDHLVAGGAHNAAADELMRQALSR